MEKMNDLDIYNDLPKTKIEEDRLGYQAFAKKVASTIISRKDQDGIVISINAPWGYGKTTCLNFIENDLNNIEDIKVMRFNPWVISDNKNHIIIKFLNSLGYILSDVINQYKKDKIRKDRLSLSERIARHSCLISKKSRANMNNPELNNFNIIWKTLLAQISPYLVGEMEKSNTDIHIQKENIEKLLKETNKKIVVFIDDLDRLTQDEIPQVLRLIKAVADFKFITYVVAFDRDIVSRALDQYCDNGFDYIKKIVQIPLELPKIYKEDIEELFYEKLNKEINAIKYEVNQDKKTRFYTFNTDLVQRHIKTPRDINLLFNGFMIGFNMIKEDVDLIDFLAIEILRVFEPELYKEIRNNLNFFIDNKEFVYITDEKNKIYFNKIAEQYSIYIEVIKELFPRTGKYLNGMQYGDGHDEGWDIDKRVCAKKRANNYFGFRLELGAISDLDAATFLESIKKQEDLDNAINKWSSENISNGRSLLFYWVPKLTTMAKSICEKNLAQIFINATFKFKDSFVDSGDADYSSLFGTDNDLRFFWLHNEIMKNIQDEQSRFDILKNATIESDNLSAIAKFMIRHAISHGLMPDLKDNIQPTITKEQYLEIEKILFEKIKLNTSRIHEFNNPMRLLHFMKVRAECLYKTAMEYYLDADEDFIKLLELLYGSVTSSEKGQFKVIRTWPIQQYYTDDTIIERMQKIQNSTPALVNRATKIIEDIFKKQNQ